MPHVVIGDVSHYCVVHFGFARQERLWRSCHADDVHAKLPPDQTLAFGAEARPLDSYKCPALVNCRSGFRTRSVEQAAQIGAKWVGHANVRHDAIAKEAPPTLILRIIKKLIRNDDV